AREWIEVRGARHAAQLAVIAARVAAGYERQPVPLADRPRHVGYEGQRTIARHERAGHHGGARAAVVDLLDAHVALPARGAERDRVAANRRGECDRDRLVRRDRERLVQIVLAGTARTA